MIFVFNLVFMGAGAYFAYQQSPDCPEQIIGAQGEVLATNEDIVEGKKAFQQNGLMNLSSILSNGAYFGADYIADAQVLMIANMRQHVARERFGTEVGSYRFGEYLDVVLSSMFRVRR